MKPLYKYILVFSTMNVKKVKMKACVIDYYEVPILKQNCFIYITDKELARGNMLDLAKDKIMSLTSAYISVLDKINDTRKSIIKESLCV